MDKEKIKRVFDEINKVKNKNTTIDDKDVVEQDSTYEKLTSQLVNMHNEHASILKKIRNQPIDVVEKLLEQVEK